MRIALLLSVFVFFDSSFAQTVPSLNAQDITEFTNAIVSAYSLVPSYGTPCNACDQGHAIGGLVRLAFHDCIGGGGCNGCVDLNLADNRGLGTVITRINAVHQPFAARISKADFWILAANVAIAHATTPAVGGPPLPNGMAASPGTLTLPFNYGRIDAANCTGMDDGTLPGAGFSWMQIAAIFQTKVGMTVNENVAILGAHSLGKATFQNSGFEGGWTVVGSSFSNFYFLTLQGRLWQNGNSSNVWVDPNNQAIMLTADVEALYSPSAQCPSFRNGNGPGQGNSATCVLNTGAGNPSDIVKRYATDISAFFTDFSSAYQKMMEFGYTNLRAVDNAAAMLLSNSLFILVGIFVVFSL